jgi:PAS domain S-box-containing protein
MSADPHPPSQADFDRERSRNDELNERIRRLIDTANDAVVTIDQQSVIIDWNAAAESTFGWSRAEAVGRVLTDLIVPAQHREHHRQGLARFLASGHQGILNQRVETTALDRSGREFNIELSIWPVRTGTGFTFSSFIRDISARKDAEEALHKSKERYRVVVENANEGIIVSQDGFLKFANPKALALSGRTMEESLATPFIELVHPDDRARVYGNYLRRMRGEAVENYYSFRIVTSTGELRWLQISAVSIEWEGKPATLNFLSDVTSQVLLQANLKETLAEREAILDTTAVGILLLQGGRIKWVNSALEQRILAYAPGGLFGKSGESAFSSREEWKRCLAECIPALSTEGAYENEWQMRRSDGSHVWCRLSGRAIDPADLGRGTIWVCIDVTRRRRAEEEMRRALSREKELSDLKTRFVAMASHEFRTPLATILSSVELLEDFGENLPTSERREITNLIKGAVGRMNGMLEQVMLIGRAETDRLEFRPQPLDARAFCERLLAETRRGAPQAAIAFEHSGERPERSLDEKLLHHAIANLLSNAIKYSPAGSGIRLRLDCLSGELRFTVADTGIGIPAEDQPRLFETFHRARNVGNVQGTGLGLAIVRQFVGLHGGEVTFESAAGRGSTFVVRIPDAPE